ncbi:MAG: iron-sulfur cluster assembly accessory protein [Gammaproteobacteria bacterium]|nr:iron-sulfur cluster assembly accessory protein [Gammaproteobacteria bacterium]
MSETVQKLTSEDMTLTPAAQSKIVELMSQVEGDEVKGVRVYVAGSGCSGPSFGMTFASQIEENDSLLEGEGFAIIVDENAFGILKGVEIDFSDNGVSGASFVFNNLAPAGASGCGTCGSSSSQGGGCS